MPAEQPVMHAFVLFSVPRHHCLVSLQVLLAFDLQRIGIS